MHRYFDPLKFIPFHKKRFKSWQSSIVWLLLLHHAGKSENNKFLFLDPLPKPSAEINVALDCVPCTFVLSN